MKKMLKIGVRPQHSTKEEVASSKFKVQSWQPCRAPFRVREQGVSRKARKEEKNIDG